MLGMGHEMWDTGLNFVVLTCRRHRAGGEPRPGLLVITQAELRHAGKDPVKNENDHNKDSLLGHVPSLSSGNYVQQVLDLYLGVTRIGSGIKQALDLNNKHVRWLFVLKLL